MSFRILDIGLPLMPIGRLCAGKGDAQQCFLIETLAHKLLNWLSETFLPGSFCSWSGLPKPRAFSRNIIIPQIDKGDTVK